MSNTRTQIKVSILSHIVPRLAAEAKRKNWDIDLVLEEALIHYLDSEKIGRRYTDPMKETKIHYVKTGGKKNRSKAKS